MNHLELLVAFGSLKDFLFDGCEKVRYGREEACR